MRVLKPLLLLPDFLVQLLLHIGTDFLQVALRLHHLAVLHSVVFHKALIPEARLLQRSAGAGVVGERLGVDAQDVGGLKDAVAELPDGAGHDTTVFLAGTALNFVDHRMKNVIDRIRPLATMYIHIVDGQCRHVPRYEKKLRLGLLYSGTADGAYLNQWMDRVALNLGGESLGSYPIAEAKEVLSCI